MEPKDIDVAYSSEPWWYDVRGFLILTFAYQTTLPSQIRLFGRNIGPRHLEAAIGTGTLFELILRLRSWRKRDRSEIVGFDYAEKMLAGARQRFAQHSNIELVRADIAALPFANDHFDTVNIANAIHCLPDVQAGFDELRRVLRPGGTLAGNVLLYPVKRNWLNTIAVRINDWGMRKGILHRPYTKDEIQTVIRRSGFEVLSEQVQGNSYSFTLRRPA